ncbi:phage antirepressor [Paenibacillus donghaensis]|uniref:Bro-N domain-containing protein n=1 Tax=Paenibacillus donghaensis TaxID=414771 RepID=A0A2Z2KK85_9BACL|nr:phage antirepressor KilAC domain-containing protein [Paenibacillus donghaensis]ASA22769.1 hypothetical protein B9T62_19370 [Paenibacillus donghaensis]
MKNGQLQMFEGNEVMILTKEDVSFGFKGDFLIRAKDVSAALDYERVENVIKLCKSDQVFKVKNSDFANTAKTKLNNTGESFFTNLALNRVLGKSEMPNAEPFQDWLFEEVLPSIQKTGTYGIVTNAPSYMIDNPIERAKRWIQEREETELLQTNNLILEQVVAEYTPKVTYFDTILNAKDAILISQIASDYDLTPQKLNKILNEEKVQHKLNGQWLLLKKHLHQGYTKSETHHYKDSLGVDQTKMNTKWTQKGRLFIHSILEKLEIKPAMDKFNEVNI